MNKKKTFFLLLFVLVVLGIQIDSDFTFTSTYSAKNKGAMALYEYLAKHDVKVSRFLEPFTELNEKTEFSSLIVISPKLNLLNVDALIDWIEKGNKLFVFTNGENLDNLFSELELNPNSFVKDIFGSSFNLGQEVKVSCLKNFSRFCQGLNKISNTYLSYAEVLSQKGFDILVETEEKQAVVIAKKIGRGDIKIVFGDAVVRNRDVDKHDNLNLILALLGNQKSVAFDEFHQGFTKPALGVVKQRIISLEFLVGYIVFIFCVYAISRGVRFGRPIQERELLVSSSIDFTTACGLLYKRHSAFIVLKNYTDAWKRRIARSYGLNPNMKIEKLSEELVRIDVIEKEEKELLLKSIRELESPPVGIGKYFVKQKDIIIKDIENLIK